MEGRWGAAAPEAGARLLLMEHSLALLALNSLLCCQILLQQGPWGKGANDNLMIEILTPEAPACCHLSCCSIEGGDIQLLVEGTEWETVYCTLMPELGIITEDGSPVEMLVKV